MRDRNTQKTDKHSCIPLLHMFAMKAVFPAACFPKTATFTSRTSNATDSPTSGFSRTPTRYSSEYECTDDMRSNTALCERS